MTYPSFLFPDIERMYPVVEKFNEYFIAVIESNTVEKKENKSEKVIELMN